MKNNRPSPMQENYSYILREMSGSEIMWARAFELYEKGILRGRMDIVSEAFARMTGRYMLVHEEELALQRIQDSVRGNPVRVETHTSIRKRKTNAKRPGNSYEAYDHQKHNGTSLDDDGEEVERGIATNPEENLVEAINESQVKKCSLERLVEDYKLSKIAKADLLERTQKMTYEAMTYTFHGTQYMNLNYILKGVNGQLYVQDQHDRIQALDLYLKRTTSDSYATHAEVWYPNRPGTTWVFKAGAKSNIEGKAVQYEVR